MNRRDVLAALGTASVALGGCLGAEGDNTTPTTDGPPSEEPSTETPRKTDTQSDSTTTSQTRSCDGPGHSYLTAPECFQITSYMDQGDLGGGSFSPGPQSGPRLLATHRDTLYATVPSQGRVVAFIEDGAEGTSPTVTTVVENLNRPHGIAFHRGDLYLALESAVVRYGMDGLTDVTSQEMLVDDIPRGKFHWTRTIAVQGSRVYLSAGSCTSGECNSGNDRYLTTITAFDLDGSNPTTYATGLRNAVGLEWHDGKLFATDNGIDDLGPDRPPDEINIIKEGHDYGFPDCYGDNIPVPDRGSGTDCEGKTPPAVELQAHVAPLGLGFATTDTFPEKYRGDLYVALHGSWTRDEPVGYKIRRVPYVDGSLGTPEDFITGWMPQGGTNEDARGRPVDVVFSEDEMYVSDDLSGEIYRINFNNKS